MTTPKPSPSGSSAASTERDYAAEIIDNIAPGYSTRRSAAQDYAWGIVYHNGEIDWPKVNAAIIERWSVAGLTWIKREAWKLAEANSRG